MSNVRILSAVASVTLVAGQPLEAASISVFEVDETTNDAWRTADVPKPDGDGNNVYGTDGHYIAQYADGGWSVGLLA